MQKCYLKSLLICFIFIMSYKSTYSQIFSPDKIIDSTTVGLIRQNWPDIAVSKDGTVGISWVEHTTSNNYPIQFKKYDVQNDTFYGKTTVQNAPLPSYDDWRTHTQVVFDTAGHPIVCWIYNNYQLMASFIKIARSYDYGATFIAPYFKRFTFDIAPSLIVTENNDLLISWITETPFPWEPEIRFVRMPDCGMAVSDSTTVYKYSDLGLGIESQAMTVDDIGNIYVFWNSHVPPLQEPRRIYLAKSIDNGVSFDSSFQILPDSADQFEMRVSSVENKIYLSFISSSFYDQSLHLTRTEGDSFMYPITIYYSTNGPLTGFTLSYEKSSGIIATYAHLGEIFLKRSKTSQGNFEDSVFVANGSWHVSAQDSMGNIFIVSMVSLPYLKLNWGNMLITGIDNFRSLNIINPELFVYPNPFNSSVNIKFTLNKSGPVSVDIYNVLGEKVSTILNKPLPAGTHLLKWGISASNTGNLSSGIYLVRFQSLEKTQTTKILYLK